MLAEIELMMSILYSTAADLRLDFMENCLQGHSAPVAHLCVDESGGLLASGSADRTVRVWNTDGFYCTHVFRGHRQDFHAQAMLCTLSRANCLI